MPVTTEHAPGTFCWADLSTSDQPAAIAFYGELFGWEFAEPNPDFGGYANASKDGQLVGGCLPLMAEGQPVAWLPYLATDDGRRTAQQITDNGGELVGGTPHDVADLGVMVVASDPTGAVFGSWEAKSHKGFGRTMEPGAPAWFELWTRDHAAADAFYTALFGYRGEQMGDGTNFDYTVLSAGDEQVGGTTVLPADVPAQVPAHWLVYFNVADPDDTVATVRRLGGSIEQEPTDSPYGRMATVADPQGGRFAVIGPMPTG